MSSMSATTSLAGRDRPGQAPHAFGAFCATITVIGVTAATYYVLVLLLIAFVERIVSVEALARAGWLSIHPAALANLILAPL